MGFMEKLIFDELVIDVVDKAPSGAYEIWSIGANAPAGYVLFCLLARQPFEGARNIDIHSLKAVRVDGAEAIMKAAACGCTTMAKMRKYLQRHSKARKGTYEYRQCSRIQRALPHLAGIGWA